MRELNDIKETDYKPHFEVADRYVGFSSELMRLSLLALSGMGAGAVFLLDSKLNFKLVPQEVICLFMSIACFALCCGFCLYHRFYATDFLSAWIAWLGKSDRLERKTATRHLRGAKLSLIAAEWSFGIAVVFFIVTLFVIVLRASEM